MKPMVGFDLDEVLLNLRDGTHSALTRRLGSCPPPAEWNQYNFFHTVGVPTEEYLSMLVEECLLEYATIEPGAYTTVHEIRSMGFRTAIVTSRAYHPRAMQVTLDWLHRHAIEMDDVVVVGRGKVDALRKLGAVAYVDDHAKNLWEIHDAGLPCSLALLDRPWNRSEQDAFKTLTSITQYPEFVRRVADVAAAA